MVVNIQTLKDIRYYLLKELHGTYPEQEISAITNLILKTHFGIDRLHIISDPGLSVSTDTATRLVEICNELKTGKPVQHILGETSFYDCIIKVNNKTLIPRPETEELVDLIIKENSDYQGEIIDFGTGSGCIAIALKKNLPRAHVFGIDISEDALVMARSNATLNNADVSFFSADIFNPDPQLISQAGIIVSNPPYVLESEKQFMSRNVIDFEPHNALFVPDENPLMFYNAITALSGRILEPGGKIYFEINEKQGLKMVRLLESEGFTEVKIIDDINGRNRIVKGIMNG